MQRQPMQPAPSFTTLREHSRRPGGDGSSMSSADSMYGPGSDHPPTATHDISRVSYHIRHLDAFAQTLQESASRAFPNRGRSLQRYSKVLVLLLHWKCDDLFVLPELVDLDTCLRDMYEFDTEIFPIPSGNSHLELMLKIADMIKQNECEETLFIIYYAGHARIDESRQSTWCATCHADSPWLQWSAIQTLLERSVSDVLTLLDCCAGAASATFAHGKSITETISASSWDAIAPEPGRYSFTATLIEVLKEWRARTFSAVQLHAELLARLKHPRRVLNYGKRSEPHTTPVHFMMTSNHKATSIELGRMLPASPRPPSPPESMPLGRQPPPPQAPGGPPYQDRYGVAGRQDAEAPLPPLSSDELIPRAEGPNEDKPHVMISLALEDNQELDLCAWQSWLSSFPALAEYVKVQGVFKSHSTLLLLSVPVMIWDMLPEDPACSFVAFIRSNNLLGGQAHPELKISTAIPTGEEVVPHPSESAPAGGEDGQSRPRAAEGESIFSGTTFDPGDEAFDDVVPYPTGNIQYQQPALPGRHSIRSHLYKPLKAMASTRSFGPHRQTTAPTVTSLAAPNHATRPEDTNRTLYSNRSRFMNQHKASKKATFTPGSNVPVAPAPAKHVIQKLEKCFESDPEPNLAITEIIASSLGVETVHVHCWFHHRRLQKQMENNLQNLRLEDQPLEPRRRGDGGVRMILAGHLNALMSMFPPPSRAGGGGQGDSMLLIDLRSAGEFEKSHVHGAVNLQAPLRFVASPATTLEMIEGTLVTDSEGQGHTGRRSFNRWFQSRCIVFYDRAVEFDWECPVAEALCDKFRRKGWLGQCFVLRGNYHEFSASFNHYINGSKMSQEAERYLVKLAQQHIPTKEDLDAQHERYKLWMQNFEQEDRYIATPEVPPHQRVKRERAVELHQHKLEAYFEARFPPLWKRVLAQARQPATSSSPVAPSPPPEWTPTSFSTSLSLDRKQHSSHASLSADASGTAHADHDAHSYPPEKKGKDADSDLNFDLVKGPMVGHLASGLDKMRQAASGGDKLSSSSEIPEFDFDREAAGGNDLGYIDYASDKLGQQPQQPPPNRCSDDYDKIDPKSEGLRNDPAFQLAGRGAADPGAGGAYPGHGGENGSRGGGGGDGLKMYGGAAAMDDESHRKLTKRGLFQMWRSAIRSEGGFF